MTSPGRGPDQGHDQQPAAENGAAEDRAAEDRAAEYPAGDDPEERDPGLARERTSLAWTRTAISFAAVGGVMLRVNVISGLVILVIAPVIWQLGRVTRSGVPQGRPPASELPVVGAHRLFIIAVSIAAVALLCLVVALLGRAAPGALR